MACVAGLQLCAVAVRAETPQAHYIDHGGVTLYAETTGDLSQSPVMVFVHGSGSDARIYAGQVDYYKRKHGTVAVDLRGHGRSDGPLDSDYSFQMWADDLHFVLGALGATGQIVCVGGNFGANVCLQYAHDHNDSVAKLVLHGGNPLSVAATRAPSLTPGPAAWEYAEFTYATHGQVCWLINSTIAAPQNPYYMYFLNQVGDRIFSDLCDNLDEARAYIRANALGESPQLAMRKLGCFGQNLNAWPFNNQFPLLPAIRDMGKPALVFVGSENVRFSRGYSLTLALSLMPLSDAPTPGATTPIVTMPLGRGIYLNAADVDGFNAEVDKFMAYSPALDKCDVAKF